MSLSKLDNVWSVLKEMAQKKPKYLRVNLKTKWNSCLKTTALFCFKETKSKGTPWTAIPFFCGTIFGDCQRQRTGLDGHWSDPVQLFLCSYVLYTYRCLITAEHNFVHFHEVLTDFISLWTQLIEFPNTQSGHCYEVSWSNTPLPLLCSHVY